MAERRNEMMYGGFVEVDDVRQIEVPQEMPVPPLGRRHMEMMARLCRPHKRRRRTVRKVLRQIVKWDVRRRVERWERTLCEQMR